MALLTVIEIDIHAGDYFVKVTLNGGTAKMQEKNVDDVAFTDVLNTTGAALFPADISEIFTFRRTELKAILTGSAVISIGPVKQGAPNL